MKKTKLGRLIENTTIKGGSFVGKHKFLYYFLNFTWGLLSNIIGGLIFLVMLPFRLPRKRAMFIWSVESNLTFNGHTINTGSTYNWGFSIGIFFFTSVGAYNNMQMCMHEFGHSCQNAIFGPFQVLLVLIPSVVRYWYRLALTKAHKKIPTEYDDIWFEGSASEIGRVVYDSVKSAK